MHAAALGRVALAAVGIAILVRVVQLAGPEEVLGALAGAQRWIPLLVVLEAARIGCDALSTRLVLGDHARGISRWRMFVVHVIGHGVMNIAPAGRAASESIKAALLARELGPAEVIATGTANQANVLLSSALFSLPCAAAAAMVSTRPMLATLIFVHALVLFGTGAALRIGSRHPEVIRWLAARFPRWAPSIERFAEHSRASSLLAWGPVLAMMAGRGVQTVEYAILAHSVGVPITLPTALAVQGTNLVAAALGVIVPGQVGSSEAVFALAAEALGTTPARATTIALVAHAIALGWAVAGLLALGVWRSVSPEGTPSTQGPPGSS